MVKAPQERGHLVPAANMGAPDNLYIDIPLPVPRAYYWYPEGTLEASVDYQMHRVLCEQ